MPIGLVVFVIAAAWVGAAFLVAASAARKGRSYGLWFFYALCVSPLWASMLVSGMAPIGDHGDLVACPRCAEHIQRAAKMCRFCGAEVVPVPAPTPAQAQAARDETNARLYKGGLLYTSAAEIIADIDAALADRVPVADIERYWVSLRASNKVNERGLAIALAHLGVRPAEVD